MKILSLSLISAVLSLSMSAEAYANERVVKGARTVVTNSQTDATGAQHEVMKKVALRAEIWKVHKDWKLQNKSVHYYSCDYDPVASGASEFFVNYLNLPQSSQPQELARALPALGYDRAREIVYSNKGFLSIRPANWNEFSDEIWKIEQHFTSYNSNFRNLWYDLIIVNGPQNMRSLGYAHPGFYAKADTAAPTGAMALTGDNTNYNDDPAPPSSAPSSGDGDYNDDPAPPPPSSGNNGDYNDPAPPSGPGNGGPAPAPAPAPAPPAYNCKYTYVNRLIWSLESEERLEDVHNQEVQIIFLNSVLLKGESESVTVSWDGKGTSVSINKDSAINKYTETRDESETKFILTSTGRKAIPSYSGDFQRSFNYSAGKFTLDVVDQRAEEIDSLTSGNYKLNVTVSVQKKTSGTCSTTNTAILTSKTFTADNGKISEDLSQYFSEAPQAKDVVEITSLTIERVGTDYFKGLTDINSGYEVKVPETK